MREGMAHREDQKVCNMDSNRRGLEKRFLEEWVFISDTLSEGHSTIETPMHHKTDYSEHNPRNSQDIGQNKTPFAKKNLLVERWVYAAEEQNAKDVPVHITTMAHDDESSAGQMNFTQNSNEALLRRSVS